MATPQEQRNIRLKNDYREMSNIKGKVIDWKVLNGSPPFVESYELTVFIKTIIDPRPEYREKHTIRVTLPGSYPFTSAPEIRMTSKPFPFHPNWFKDGKWCFGTWDIAEGLGHHVIRMIKTLQYDLDITNEHSPARADANEWYKIHRLDDSLIPCDKTSLPDPSKSKFKIKGGGPKTFKFKSM